MNDADNLLAGLWAQDEPPARDPAFVAAVMETVARRRLRAQILQAGALAVVAAAGLWAVAPMIEAGASTLSSVVASDLFGFAVAGAFTLWLILSGAQRPMER